jgi:hypothetical protein
MIEDLWPVPALYDGNGGCEDYLDSGLLGTWEGAFEFIPVLDIPRADVNLISSGLNYWPASSGIDAILGYYTKRDLYEFLLELGL